MAWVSNISKLEIRGSAPKAHGVCRVRKKRKDTGRKNATSETNGKVRRQIRERSTKSIEALHGEVVSQRRLRGPQVQVRDEDGVLLGAVLALHLVLALLLKCAVL
jgi:hypothetical protein